MSRSWWELCGSTGILALLCIVIGCGIASDIRHMRDKHISPQAEATPVRAHYLVTAGAAVYEAYQVMYALDGRVYVWTEDGCAVLKSPVKIEFRP